LEGEKKFEPFLKMGFGTSVHPRFRSLVPPIGSAHLCAAFSTVQWPVATMCCVSTGEGWSCAKVRGEFIKYFQEQCEHTFYVSSPCVPLHDPTLLFINAGMNQVVASVPG
jgi:hypothetical protein